MAYPAPQGTELVALIGAGSVFEVALVREVSRRDGARDEPDHAVVCKRLRPRVRDEPAGRAALAREAQLLSLARHPSLPALLRVGTDAGGPFVIETFAEGASLRAVTEAARARRGGGVPARLFAHLAHASATALAELHELRDATGPLEAVHGDLAPEHVRMDPHGEIRFVDFGAARYRGMDARLDAGDRGTLPFVAPEIARGERTPDQGGDVYALAATLLFLATGEPLAPALDEGALLLVIGEGGLPPSTFARLDAAPSASPRARDALRAALALDPSRRIRSARALADALD
jgi:eukaryotic-like serine/threonine-protein kinase